MKLTLDAMEVESLDGCVDVLVKRVFDSHRKVDGKSAEVDDALFRILEGIKKDELVDKYLVSKSAYGRIILDALAMMSTRMAFMSPSFCVAPDGTVNSLGDADGRLAKVIGFSKVLMKFDPEFVPSLRDADGDNMLMIFARVLRFDKVKELISRVGGNLNVPTNEVTGFDNFVDGKYGCGFFRSFIVDMKCDPYAKNNDGRCFADYFSFWYLRTSLGYNPYDFIPYE
jgi:hypothetical protein